MNLHPLSQAFVLHFGEMGSRWGINRTVGQIYAALYVIIDLRARKRRDRGGKGA